MGIGDFEMYGDGLIDCRAAFVVQHVISRGCRSSLRELCLGVTAMCD